MRKGLGHNIMHKGTKKGVARAFNKKVKPRNLKEGDLILKVLKDETSNPRGKMKPRWSSPFVIKKIRFGFAQSTWIDSENTTSKQRERKKPSR